MYLALQRGGIKMWFSHYIPLIVDCLYWNFLPHKSKKSPGALTYNNLSREKEDRIPPRRGIYSGWTLQISQSITAVQIWQKMLYCNVSREMKIKDFAEKIISKNVGVTLECKVKLIQLIITTADSLLPSTFSQVLGIIFRWQRIIE